MYALHNNISKKLPIFHFYFPELFIATKVMASCALAVIFVYMVCLIFYVGSQRSRTRGMAIAIMTLAYVAGTCNTIYLYFISCEFGHLLKLLTEGMSFALLLATSDNIS